MEVTTTEISALGKARRLLARYSSREWQATISIVSFLRGEQEEMEKIPKPVRIHSTAALKESNRKSNLKTLVPLMSCGYPQIEIQVANRVVAMLSQKVDAEREDTFESILEVVTKLWDEKKTAFPNKAKIYTQKGREFARDLWGLIRPTTRIIDMDNAKLFMEKYFFIDTKAGRRVRLELNRAQRHYHKQLTEITKSIPERGTLVDMLKARQLGMSTYHLALLVVFLISHPHTNAVIVADKATNLINFLKMIEIYIESLPFQPARSNPGSVDAGIFFSRGGLDATISFFTAGGDDPGTSRTIHFMFCTESAKWPGTEIKIRNNLDSLNAARVEKSFTFLIHETTADGQNWYYNRYRKLRAEIEHKRQSNYDLNKTFPAFYGWYWDDEYKLKAPKHWIMPVQVQEYVDSHPELMNFLRQRSWDYQFKDRMYWAWMKVKESCSGDWDRFKKEYPMTWEEAFSGSAENFFSSDTLFALRKTCCLPKFEGSIHLAPNAAAREAAELTKDDIVFTRGRGGIDSTVPFKQWEDPREECDYIIGIDAASGTASHSPDSADYGVALVFNQTTMQFVAQVRMIATPEVLAECVLMLAVLYQGREGPYIIPTRTDGYGSRVIGVLIRPENEALAKYHMWRKQDESDITGKISKVVGFSEAGGNNRDALYDTLRSYMDAYAKDMPQRWKFYNEDLINECATFVWRKNKYQHATGEHDDIVTAASLCLYAHNTDQTPDLKDYKAQVAKKKKGPMSDKFAKRLRKTGNKKRDGSFGFPRLI